MIMANPLQDTEILSNWYRCNENMKFIHLWKYLRLTKYEYSFKVDSVCFCVDLLVLLIESTMNEDKSEEKVPFEVALDKTGRIWKQFEYSF